MTDVLRLVSASTVGVLLALALGLTPAAEAAGLAVKYRTADHVYVDGGRGQGLSVGDRLLVKSGSSTVAELEVEFVAERSASCKIVSESRPVRTGDRVVRSAQRGAPAAGAAQPEPEASPPAVAPEPSSPARPATPPAAAEPRATHPWAQLRGGLSLGYSRVVDDTPSAFDFEQTTARLDLTVSEIGGRPLALTARMRSRQDRRARALGSTIPQDERQDRMYELALRYEPPSEALRIEAGRIGISRFAGIGYLDGALVEARVAEGLHVGGFGGRRADPSGIEAGGLGPKYGVFVRLAPGARWTRPWEVLVGAVREMAESDVSREYVSIESRIRSGRRFSLVELAEIDWNRGWRQAASGGRTLQLSRLAVTLNTRLSERASAALSYNNRRNYRSHLNRQVPEQIFDDLTRQGLQGRVSFGRGQGLSAATGGGVRLGDRDGKRSYSAFGSVRNGSLFGGPLSVGLDASAFKGAFGSGWMTSARLGRRFVAGHSLDLSYSHALYHVGLRSEVHRTQWVRLAGRFELPHRLAVLSDLEYARGDDAQGPRFSLELGYRF